MTGGLTRDTVLERAPAITLTLLSAGNATATVAGNTVGVGLHALEVLAACNEPKRLEDLAQAARVTGGRDFVDFVATIFDLVQQGLLNVSGRGTTRVDARGQWNDPAVQAPMIADIPRTRAFLQAMKTVVRPDDVVLDIGTGTGILAIAAAKAGARRVFAIEASAMADTATAMVKANGVEDRVEVLRGWSTRLTLPERATVLVTETIGNDPLGEYALDILLDAKRRLLVDDARVVPGQIRLYATLIEAPSKILDRFTFTSANALHWAEAFGLDFSALLREENVAPVVVSLLQERAKTLIELTEPVEIGRLDFANPQPLSGRRFTLKAVRDGMCNGVMLTFEVDVAPGLSLTIRPSLADETNHWQPTIWLEPKPRELLTGYALDVEFRQVGGAAVLEIVT